MAKSTELRLWAFHNEPAAKLACKLVVSKDTLIELTNGLSDKLCYVEKADKADKAEGSSPVRRQAILSAAPNPLKKTLAQMSKTFRSVCSLGPQDKIRVTTAGVIPEATDVVVEDITEREDLTPLAADPQLVSWVSILEDQLDLLEFVYPGMVVPNVFHRRSRRTFRVQSVNGKEDSVARFVVDKTQVTFPTFVLPDRTIATGSPTVALSMEANLSEPPPVFQIDPIPGLEDTVAKLNREINYVQQDRIYNCVGHGIVLEGSKGTGKSMLLRRVAAVNWGAVYHIQPTDKLDNIVLQLEEAAKQTRSLILFDNITKLLDKERSNHTAVVTKLDRFFDSIVGERIYSTVVIATCRDYLKDIPEELREEGRFQSVISIPSVDAKARYSILKSFNLPFPPDETDAMLQHWVQHTHAFDGKDLALLCHKVNTFRELNAPHFTLEHFAQARAEFNPSVMNNLVIKPPPVYWKQIHGQETLVSALREAVYMLNHPDEYKPYFDKPPRGFFLYGPPGCAKTMTAQAMATESGFNYISVKGGEVLNMYVGESERQIRDLFRQAKQLAPCVLFFDEVDSIAGRRSDFGDKSASSSRGHQAVAALLTEMDGFEPLNNVIVLAATNRPEAVDPALLRSGRFDQHYYVAPPTAEARKGILQVLTQLKVCDPLDLDVLAAKTEGYSGAEVVGFCDTVRNQAYMKRANITMAMVEEAFQKKRPTITREMLDFYSNWSV